MEPASAERQTVPSYNAPWLFGFLQISHGFTVAVANVLVPYLLLHVHGTGARCRWLPAPCGGHGIFRSQFVWELSHYVHGLAGWPGLQAQWCTRPHGDRCAREWGFRARPARHRLCCKACLAAARDRATTVNGVVSPNPGKVSLFWTPIVGVVNGDQTRNSTTPHSRIAISNGKRNGLA